MASRGGDSDSSPPPPPSSDEELRKLLKPCPTTDQVLDCVRESLAEGARDDDRDEPKNADIRIVKELDSYDDVNYLVSINGARRLAKIHNGVESDGYVRAEEERRRSAKGGETKKKNARGCAIDLQASVFEHLSDPKYGIVASAPAPGASLVVRSLPVRCPARSPHPLVVRILTYIDGVPLSSAPSIPIETLATCGARLGKLDAALDELPTDVVDAAERYHAWDGRNTSDLAEYVDCIDDEKRRQLVSSVVDAFRSEFVNEDGAREFRRGVIMGDFNDANVLVDEGGREVRGVIDFGDSVRSWRVLDVTVAMAYAMLSAYGKCGRSVSAAAAILRGFHSVYPLMDIERRHLRLLVACRLACSVTLGAYSYKQNPENEYLLLHAKPAWEALELIWGGAGNSNDSVFARAIDRMFDVACDGGKKQAEGELMDCSDIALPDPRIADPLQSVRSGATRDEDEETAGPPPPKKQKTNGTEESPVVTFVTGNKKKMEEVKRILGSELPFAMTNRKIDLPELQGEDPIEIAKEKCALAAERIGGAVITEDTSLCFDALNGLPGPYVKWFLDKCGLDGLNNMIAFSDDKSAYAQTVVAFCPGPGKDVSTFDGRTKGKIVPERGSREFGWDPIFKPDESEGLTYAEMSPEGKDAISHRSRAFARLREHFAENRSDVLSQMRR